MGLQLQHVKVPVLAQRFPRFEWPLADFLPAHMVKATSKIDAGRFKGKTKNGKHGLAP